MQNSKRSGLIKLKRQRFHSITALGILGLLFAGCGEKLPYSKEKSEKNEDHSRGADAAPGELGLRSELDKPNIIYILADDLGLTDIGCYNHLKVRQQHVKIETPHLDALCAQGMAFTNHYAGAAVCAPTRSSLLTGTHMGHSRVRGNSHTNPAQPQEALALLPEDTTVGEVLKRAGYVTSIVGKWGVGLPGSPGTPEKKGFDHSYGFLDQGKAHNHYPPEMVKNGVPFAIPENEGNNAFIPAQASKKNGRYANDLFTEEALSFVESNKNKPFHLQLWYTLPHAGLEVPADSLAQYINRWGPEVPYPGNGHYPPQSHPHAAYAAMITRLDRDIGKLIAKLDSLGLQRNTIVFFASDNGASAAGGIDREFFNSMGPLRDYKGALYEGGIRAPLIAWWPGKIPAGQKSPVLTASWDFMATAAALAGVEAPKNDGVSLVPTLLGKAGQVQTELLYWEKHSSTGLWQAARRGPFKLVKTEANQFELYNLESDPGEQQDLYHLKPDVVADLKIRMVHQRTPNPLYPQGSMDLLGIQCNASGKAAGRWVDEGLRSIACLEDALSPTRFSWQPVDARNLAGVQCNASGQAAWKVNGNVTCAPDAGSPSGWRWKPSAQVQVPGMAPAPQPQMQAPAAVPQAQAQVAMPQVQAQVQVAMPQVQAQAPVPQTQAQAPVPPPTPNPNDAGSYIGYQCNANRTAAGKIADVAGKSIVCLESSASPTGFAWTWLNTTYPLGAQCNSTGQAMYKVAFGNLTCKPFTGSPTGWRWQR